VTSAVARSVTAVFCIMVIATCVSQSEQSSVAATEEQDTRFNKIPFFVFRDGKEASSETDLSECKDDCEKANECRSISYSQKKKDCMWSTHAISFDTAFTFYTKKNACPEPCADRYDDIEGLKYQSLVWTEYRADDAKDCEALCDAGKDAKGRYCHGFSYNKGTRDCLLSPFGISYDTDYDYYEKTRAVKVAPVPESETSVKFAENLSSQELLAKSDRTVANEVESDKTVVRKEKQELEQELEADTITEKKVEQKAEKKKELGRFKKVAKQNELNVLDEEEEAAKRMKLEKKEELTVKQERRDEDMKNDAARKREEELLNKEISMKNVIENEKLKQINERGEKRREVMVLVKEGRALVAREAKNKAMDKKDAENDLKEQEVKVVAEKAMLQKAAKYKTDYQTFVKTTLEAQLAKTDANQKREAAMTEEKAAVQGKLDSDEQILTDTTKLLNEGVLRENILIGQIAQHTRDIEEDAKLGKKNMVAETKLRFANDEKALLMQKITAWKKLIADVHVKVEDGKYAVIKIDRTMTQESIGRRRAVGGGKTREFVMPVVPPMPKNSGHIKALEAESARMKTELMQDALVAAYGVPT